MKLISVKAAARIINSVSFHPGIGSVPLISSLNRILAQDILADRPYPPFDQVRMDGIAIEFKAFEAGRRRFKLNGIQAAGEAKKQLLDTDECMEVMTGAILPGSADTVIRYEDIQLADQKASIQTENIVKGQNIESQGSQRKKGDILISKAKRIGSPEIGIMASVGLIKVDVLKWPKIAVVSTGDELVPIDAKPLPHQIRRSNSYTLACELRQLGVTPEILHIKDDKKALLQRIEEVSKDKDLLIFSGGISKGKFDFLPEIFDELGIECLFHGVSQRPGKPFWFGKSDEVIVFAFPGNPVSSFVGFHRYFIPWFRKVYAQINPVPVHARLASDVEFKPSLSYFCLVSLEWDKRGRLLAKPKTGKGSGDLTNLSRVDGFLELSPEKSHFAAGELLPCYPIKNL